MNDIPTPAPKPRGRPKKTQAPLAAAPAPQAPKKYTLKAKANWDDIDADSLAFIDAPDRLHIPRDMIPEGWDLQWVTDSTWGKPDPQRRTMFSRGGWAPVCQEDFDGRFDGRWMQKGEPGEIKVDACALVARPIEYSIRARREERRKAMEQVQVKEAAFKSGDLPGVTLDANHPNAVNSNRINRSFERIEVPKD